MTVETEFFRVAPGPPVGGLDQSGGRVHPRGRRDQRAGVGRGQPSQAHALNAVWQLQQRMIKSRIGFAHQEGCGLAIDQSDIAKAEQDGVVRPRILPPRIVEQDRNTGQLAAIRGLVS